MMRVVFVIGFMLIGAMTGGTLGSYSAMGPVNAGEDMATAGEFMAALLGAGAGALLTGVLAAVVSSYIWKREG